MDIVVIYNVINRDQDIKAALRKAGFYSSWKIKDKSYLLPENCVWKVGTGLAEVKTEVLTIIDQINENSGNDNRVQLKRCIILPATIWDGVEGF